MRLADDEITIRLEGETTIHLRPTLRAAFRLERRYGGFDKLFLSIVDGNLSCMADVIRESASAPSTLPTFLTELADLPVITGLEILTLPLLSHVAKLAGTDDNETDAEPGERITFAEYHTRLFRIATGWVGWTPETAWNATAAEITEAFKGRTEMLKAIFAPAKEPGESAIPREHAPEEIRAGFEKLRVMCASGQNRAW